MLIRKQLLSKELIRASYNLINHCLIKQPHKAKNWITASHWIFRDTWQICSQQIQVALMYIKMWCQAVSITEDFQFSPIFFSYPTLTLLITKSKVGTPAGRGQCHGLCLLISITSVPSNLGPEYPAVQLGPRCYCFLGV